MADYVQVVTPWLAPALISPARTARINAVAGMFPPCPIAGIECRLGAGQHRADFQVQLPRHTFQLPERLTGDRVWKFVQDFHRESLGESVLRESVSDVGLEFDLDGRAACVPALFVALKQRAVVDAGLLTGTASRMLDRPPSAALLSNLRGCLDALPGAAAVRFVGAMLSRPSSALRVNVCGIRADDVAAYLAAVNWPHPATPLTSLLSTLADLTDALVLCLDLTDQILPRLGVECVLNRQPPEEPRWEALLARLNQLGLCTGAKQEALLQWPGCASRSQRPEHWPGSLSLGDRVLGGDAVSVFHRYLSHLKILYRPGRPLESKAYLGFYHRWTDAAELVSGNTPNGRGPVPATRGSSRSDIAPRAPRPAAAQHVHEVRGYWEETTHLYLRHWTTFQGGLVARPGDPDGARANNVYLASRAGIRRGHRVLDAGCGVCGPSIDIAQSIDAVQIDAVTLSPVQARVARAAVQQAGLADRVRLSICDYHHLPFGYATFDVVVFFESMLYSAELQNLLAEVYRVLRPGGRLYVKEIFRQAHPLSPTEERATEEFEQLFRYWTRPIAEVAELASAIGFEHVETRDLSAQVTTDHYEQAMTEHRFGLRVLSEFGRRHRREFTSVPMLFGELRARRPRQENAANESGGTAPPAA